ncbi:hypothetical protein PT273_00185 [Orbaceae bacterium ESL0727]|nr:hypothetical protein [Orbaceae bacterium ESL0727]
MMTVVHYWQQFSKRLIIKTALSHLLLGVIAAGFSLSEQNALSVQTLQAPLAEQVEIMTIAALAQDQSAIITMPDNPQLIVKSADLSPCNQYIAPHCKLTLLPNNGIRAGPARRSLSV